jgi:hypothetical protein
LLARLAIGLIQTWRLSHRAQPITAPWCAGVDFRTTAAIRAPVTFSSTILLPSDWVNWNPIKLHVVVAHEGAGANVGHGSDRIYAQRKQAEDSVTHGQ